MMNGIKQEYECETGVSQPDALRASGCDTPRRTRVRAVLIPFLTCTLDEHHEHASQKLVSSTTLSAEQYSSKFVVHDLGYFLVSSKM